MCLESERPVEVYLHCSPTARIYILKTQHGVQTPATSGNFTGCSYKEDGEDSCASMLADIRLVEKQCMGHHDCYPSLVSVYLQRCNRRSNYFQVAYKCLTGRCQALAVAQSQRLCCHAKYSLLFVRTCQSLAIVRSVSK